MRTPTTNPDPRQVLQDTSSQKGSGGYRPSAVRVICAPRDAASAESSRARFLHLYGTEPDATLESGAWTVQVGLAGDASVGWDPDQRVAVVLHGEIHDQFGETASDLARRYRVRGKSLLTDLNGSFALVVLDRDADRLMVATDMMSSRRIFWSASPRGYVLTSNLNDQPLAEHQLDPVGVAWRLANAACHAERTLFQGVEVLRNGHVHELSAQGVRSEPYWSHVVQEPADPPSYDALVDGLAERVLAAVERRAKGDLFLSLSGGNDSTAIAAVLKDCLGIGDVQSFSYVAHDRFMKPRDRQTPFEQKDAGLAALTAARLGFRHRTFEIGDSDYLDALRRAARRGEGVAAGTVHDEHWRGMAPHFALSSHPVLLVGSEYMGPTVPDRPRNQAEMWKGAHLKDLYFPPGAADLFPTDLLRTMNRGLRADKRRVLKRQGTRDLYRLRDQVGFDHRVVHAILQWRERTAMTLARVRYPWHDAEVMTYMVRVPYEVRVGKRLFRDAVSRLSPTFAEFRRTEREGSRPYTRDVVRAHAPRLRAWLEDSGSLLDEMIPLEFTRAVLEQVVDPTRARWSRSWAGRAARSRLSRVIPGLRAPRQPLDPARLFQHLAVLRMALPRHP